MIPAEWCTYSCKLVEQNFGRTGNKHDAIQKRGQTYIVLDISIGTVFQKELNAKPSKVGHPIRMVQGRLDAWVR
jgi:hypothetical protein